MPEITPDFILDFHSLAQIGKYNSGRMNVAQHLFMMVGIIEETNGSNGIILICGKDLIISHIPF